MSTFDKKGKMMSRFIPPGDCPHEFFKSPNFDAWICPGCLLVDRTEPMMPGGDGLAGPRHGDAVWKDSHGGFLPKLSQLEKGAKP